MAHLETPVIVTANQKGGVGKTTTTVNLAQALSRIGERVLVIDLDPQGNATQGFGIGLEAIHHSISDLIRDRSFPTEGAIYKGTDLDLIPSTPLLSRVEREMVGMTNSEMRLSQRLQQLRARYSVILIDTPPTFGPLMNSALNAADSVIVPVDSGFYALLGIKELLNEIEEIKVATNPKLKVLGYLMTMADNTKITQEVLDGLIENFGDQVFETRIRRSVKLKEAPALSLTIFQHAPESSGAQDYLKLANEVLSKVSQERLATHQELSRPQLSLVQGVSHE